MLKIFAPETKAGGIALFRNSNKTVLCFHQRLHFSHANHKEQQNRLLRLLNQARSNVESLKPATVKSLHALTVAIGPYADQPIFLCNNVIHLYGSVSELSMSRQVFDKMPQRNGASYNSMISAYMRTGDEVEAWKLFLDMRYCGFSPTQFTFGGLLSSASLGLCQCSQLQSLIVKSGLLCSDAFSGTALLGLFGKLGCLDEAIRVFEDMPCKTTVTWNSIVSLFANHGFVEECVHFFCELLRTGESLSKSSFVGVLSGLNCAHDLQLGEQVHGLVIKTGLDGKIHVVNSLVNMYTKCFGIHLAEKMFVEADTGDVALWNVIIGVWAKSDRPKKALELFLDMSDFGVLPNQATFVAVLESCKSLQIPRCGESLHGKIMTSSFESDVFVGTALVDFYAKCDKIHDAQHCFDEICEKNVVSWTVLILGYSGKCFSTPAFLLREMLRLGYCPNEFSFSAVVKSSLALELQQVHCLAVRMGYSQNDYVISALITSYARNGLVSEALIFVTDINSRLPVVPCNILAGLYNSTGQYWESQKLLALLEEPDLVSWNILIAACAQNGDYEEVLELFRHMHMSQIRPDKYTLVSVLSVCAKLCSLALGCSIHGLIVKYDSKCCDTFLCNVLLDMYAKCGSIESSLKIFNQISDKNVISWTALVSALGHNGFVCEALDKFREMMVLGVKPDRVAFLSVLSVCRHGGLVKEGMELFGMMKTYGVVPEMDHHLCIINLLANNGHLKEAEQFIANMPFPPNALVWRSLLEAYRRLSKE
ncbi:Pentatricopeptide repeat [Dillenia turbinata]|uniref:Pentatricopeptide repeat n=1 Tax=Dillenia turbinata TaxID=194707 RepID=A0AAN8V0L1_9MAGN